MLSRDAHVMRAMLKVGFRGIKQSFSTETHNTPPHEITIKLIDGPFRSLDGRWRFNDLSGRGCKIEFHLSWEFSSQVMGALVGSVFGHIADTMVGAFVKRAERVYVVHRD